MTHSAFDGLNEENFFDRVKAKFNDKVPNLSKTLNIVVIGKVSSGKSSLINALLKLSRKQALEIAKVGAVSGVTKDLKIIQLDEKVYLIDSPGLDDVRQENSEVTKNILKHIDIGIFVVTGSSDASQLKKQI
jgi:ribosome biogenesis GTPase A